MHVLDGKVGDGVVVEDGHGERAGRAAPSAEPPAPEAEATLTRARDARLFVAQTGAGLVERQSVFLHRVGRADSFCSIFMQDRPPSGVDARIRDDSDKAVVANLSAGGTATSAAADADPRQGLPLRPNFGTQGRQIALRANYFPVTVQGQIFQYSAEIVLPRGQNKNISRRVKQRVFRLAEACEDWAQAGLLGRVAHDSAEKLVASFLLPQPLTIRGAYYDEGDDAPAKGGSEYALTLTFVGEVDKGILNEYTSCLVRLRVELTFGRIDVSRAHLSTHRRSPRFFLR